MPHPRTIIEIVDVADPASNVCHKTREVHVNGQPVLLAQNGVDLEFEHGQITTVTLKILPTEVHFISKAKE